MSSRNELFEVQEKLVEIMGAGALLAELFNAMSTDEAKANFDHIIEMHNLESEFEDDEDDDDEDCDYDGVDDYS